MLQALARCVLASSFPILLDLSDRDMFYAAATSSTLFFFFFCFFALLSPGLGRRSPATSGRVLPIIARLPKTQGRGVNECTATIILQSLSKQRFPPPQSSHGTSHPRRLQFAFISLSLCVCMCGVCAPRRNPAPDGRTRMQNGVID